VVAAKELEDDAKKYASEAIRLDSQGAHGMAIQMYQKAISTLVKLVHLYPDYRLNKQYTERAMAYQERVKAIQAAHGLIPQDQPSETEWTPTVGAKPGPAQGPTSSTPNSPAGPQVVQQLKASFNELVVTEKPDVKWDDVIGLEDCKQAIRESIVFPFLRPDLFKLGWPRGILLYGPPGCFDEQTEILTKRGWKKYTELADDEVVATLNPTTNELEYHPIVRKIQYRYEGKMYRLESTQVSLMVTPDHQLWVGKQAQQGVVRYDFAHPADVYGRGDRGTSPYYKKDARWRGVDRGCVLIPQREPGSGSNHGELRIPMSEWAPFFGLWLAEGYTEHLGGNYQVGFLNLNQDLLNFAYDSLKRWGLDPHLSPDGRVTVVNKQLYELLRPIGGKHARYIPDEIKDLPPTVLRSLLEYYARGDGTHEVDEAEGCVSAVRCQTSSPRLRDDLMEISLKAGLACDYVALTEAAPAAAVVGAGGKETTLTRTASSYRLSIMYRRGEARVDGPVIERWEDYSGMVWDVTVQNHVIYVRRNGKAVWSGNCGKTMVAAATAAEIDGYFISVDAASIMSKWLGEGEKNVAKLFNNARKMLSDNKPVIVFVDEIDSLLGTRGQEVGGEVRVRDQFLKETDGINDKGKNLHMYVIGATNKPWSLDPPFLRRFAKRILVPLPDNEARMAQFKLYTAPLTLADDVDPATLARLSEGYSGSDIKDICQGVQLRVVRELFKSGNALDKESTPRPIDISDFKEIMRTRKPSVSPEMLRAYQQWTNNFSAL
jgi:SpoVK/Ycf46/Vps4 family AAA+-type ATPase